MSNNKSNPNADFNIKISWPEATDGTNDFILKVSYQEKFNYHYSYNIVWSREKGETLEASKLEFAEYIDALRNLNSAPSLNEVKEIITSLTESQKLELPKRISLTRNYDEGLEAIEMHSFYGGRTTSKCLKDNISYTSDQSGSVQTEEIETSTVKLTRKKNSSRTTVLFPSVKKGTNTKGLNMVEVIFNNKNTPEQLAPILAATPKEVDVLESKGSYIFADQAINYNLKVCYEENDELASEAIHDIFESTQNLLNDFAGLVKKDQPGKKQIL